MTGKRGKLRENTRFRVPRLPRDNPEMSRREPAGAAGVGIGGVNCMPNALIEKDPVRPGNFTAAEEAEDKRRHACILTRKGLAEKAATARGFLARKTEGYQAPRAEIDALAAGIESDAAPSPRPR